MITDFGEAAYETRRKVAAEQLHIDCCRGIAEDLKVMGDFALDDYVDDTPGAEAMFNMTSKLETDVYAEIRECLDRIKDLE